MEQGTTISIIIFYHLFILSLILYFVINIFYLYFFIFYIEAEWESRQRDAFLKFFEDENNCVNTILFYKNLILLLLLLFN